MDDFEAYLQHVLDDCAPSVVRDAMKYSLLGGGKRIRPALLLAALRSYGRDEREGYAAAAAIEMIHTYSLIHDDLPAMDDDTLRRGKPTCHVRYGEACAILAGDALLTQAFLLASTSCDDPRISCEIVRLLASYSGADGMVLGQILDLEGESRDTLTLKELRRIHAYKTGKLLTLPLLFAALLSGHDEDLPVWEKIGRCIGLSFQIQDDILDVTSTSEELGKNINSDIENNKTTYVSLLGIEQARQEAEHYYAEAQSLLHSLSVDPAALMEVFSLLIHRRH